jgi:hypothetical protein
MVKFLEDRVSIFKSDYDIRHIITFGKFNKAYIPIPKAILELN